MSEDPLAPARGILIGLAICIPFWTAVALIVAKAIGK